MFEYMKMGTVRKKFQGAEVSVRDRFNVLHQDRKIYRDSNMPLNATPT